MQFCYFRNKMEIFGIGAVDDDDEDEDNGSGASGAFFHIDRSETGFAALADIADFFAVALLALPAGVGPAGAVALGADGGRDTPPNIDRRVSTFGGGGGGGG